MTRSNTTMAEKYFRQPSTVTTQAHFAQIPASQIERSKFDRSHGHKTTFDEGVLVPIFLDEVLPGDTFSIDATVFARLSTPLHPFMDNLYLDTHFFWVPNRLVWDNWVNFMGERVNPTDNPEDYSVPQIEIPLDRVTGVDMASYFGIPYAQGAAGSKISVNCLPFRAYHLIWNYWYRDENLQDSVIIPRGNGPDLYNEAYSVLKARNKRKDYLTSALPWPQKGSPVYIPLGTSAPVLTDGNPVQFQVQGGVNRTLYAAAGTNNVGYTGQSLATQATFFLTDRANYDAGVRTGMLADLQAATAITINDLRTAFQVQKMLERDARGGTRYKELVLSHFGVNMPDAQWQPEYLGGSHSMINVSPIAATYSGADVSTGDLGAVATALGKTHINKSFTEHGFVMGLISVRSDLTYQNGVERFWSRITRYDYYFPTLAHLGEQAILNREVFVTGTAADLGTWGFQERYAEYRYKPGRVTGFLSSNNALSLDTWHLAQDFTTLPPLSWLFLIDAPPIERVVAVPGQQKFICDSWFRFTCDRPMPTYSFPGLVDHF
nr:MAG: major capsid protein [Microvirus sp.]